PSGRLRLETELKRTIELIKTKFLKSSASFDTSSMSQKEITASIHEIQARAWLEEATREDPAFRIIMKAQAEEKASLWKVAQATKKNILEGEIFLYAARRSIRAPVFDSPRRIGAQIFDQFGDLAISHKTGGLVTRRHN